MMKHNRQLLAAVLTVGLSWGTLQGFAAAPAATAPGSQTGVMPHLQAPAETTLNASPETRTLIACHQNEAGDCKSWWKFWGGKHQEQQANAEEATEKTQKQAKSSDAAPSPLSPTEINRLNNSNKGYYAN